MASITGTKKGIIDFLWEWADTHNDWGKLLIDIIVRTESSLTGTDRSLVFDYFLDSLRQTPKLPTVTATKPSYTPSSKEVMLTSLKNITGVNRLAKNQNLTLNRNITIIYGENGTGKTGYSRILKSLGISYDPNNSIHHNVYGKQEIKSATIDFEVNGVPSVINWDGSKVYPELSNISVFNNNCVSLSLTDRNLIVSPIGFHLFNIITSELQELASLLKQKIGGYSTTIPWINSLTPGSPQHQYLSRLSATSTLQRLTELSGFTSDQESKLQDKELELINLNPELLRIQVNNLSSQISEIDGVMAKILESQSILTPLLCREFNGLNRRISDLEEDTKSSIEQVAKLNGIEFYDSNEFKAFIGAAENYLKILDKSGYPEVGDACIYCKQPLEKSANDLLASYKRILNDSPELNIQKLNNERNSLMSQVKRLDANIHFNNPVFGFNEEQIVVQPEELVSFNKEIIRFQQLFENKMVMDDSAVGIDFLPLISSLKERQNKIVSELSDKKTLLSDLTNQILNLKTEIDELKDRKTLSGKVEEVKNTIEKIKAVKLLNAKMSEFSTASISRKTTEAREELVRKNFESIFKKELDLFRKSDLLIDINFGTEKGHSKVQQRIKTFNLPEILSEGEQKAIALAEFLTELQLDNVKAPVIFDDPVNSLDHKIIDEVSKRLIELSKSRQVIVFTHNVLLLNSFLQQSELDTNKQANVGFTFHNVRNNFDETGVLEPGGDELNGFNHYKAKLNVVLSTTSRELSEERLAAEGYGHLRSMIEVTVEENVLQRTIKRYRKGVAFPSLLRVEGHKIDAHKGALNDIYEKCCVSIAGHSSPTEIHSTPTINDLRTDYKEFMNLRSQF